MDFFQKHLNKIKVLLGIIGVATASVSGDHIWEKAHKLTECMSIIKNAVSSGELEVTYEPELLPNQGDDNDQSKNDSKPSK